MIIADEIVELAVAAFLGDGGPDRHYKIDMRAAMEAVAPALIAQGMREAANIMQVKDNMWIDDIAQYVLARAQELDPR